MEYIITFTLWQSWLFLFAISLLCIGIGYWICRVNFYKSLVDSYTRSKGKSEISLSTVDIGFIKNLAKDKKVLIITGGFKIERDGMIDYINSHLGSDSIIRIFKNVKDMESISKISTDSDTFSIVEFDGDFNVLSFLEEAHNKSMYRNILFIENKDNKSLATVHTYYDENKRYFNVIDYLNLIN